MLVTRFIKERYPNLPLNLFGHSLGSMIARIYLQNYDDEIEHLILTGTVTPYPLAPVGGLFSAHCGLLFWKIRP